MMLRVDPLQVFHRSTTPIGLYARQRWLNESQTPRWQQDFNHTTKMLYQGQAASGPWNNSVIDTIRRLFHLHLTVREQTDAVSLGLDWLLSTTLDSPDTMQEYRREKYSIESMRGIPFANSHFGIFLTTACVFLATVFGRHDDQRVLAACETLNREGMQTEGHWHGWASLTNALRALAVHPTYAGSDSVVLAVNALAHVQTGDGTWIANVPFYKTVNTLAHLNMPQADNQFERALTRLIRTQSYDGSWGRAEPEWSTFLVVHALKRKAIV
jgi:hypothetical protein